MATPEQYHVVPSVSMGGSDGGSSYVQLTRGDAVVNLDGDTNFLEIQSMTKIKAEDLNPPYLLQLAGELLNYMVEKGVTSSSLRRDWYVGLTHDLEDARVKQHNSPQEKDGWFSVKTRSFDDAKLLKGFLYGEYDLAYSEDHGGDERSVFVYVFKLTSKTTPTHEEACTARLAREQLRRRS